MKKIFIIISMLLIMLFTMAGCNKQIADFTYKYDWAVLGLPNGNVIEGEVDSWRDYGDGDQIQVTIDGVTYLTHATDVVLIDQ